MKSTIKSAMVIFATIIVAMTLGTKEVQASTQETPLKTAQNSARSLYGVKHTIDQGKGEAKAEQRFMFVFKQQGTLSGKMKTKSMKKVVKKMDNVIRNARIDYNAGNKEEALKTVTEWVEKDYEKTLDILYNK